MVKKELKIVILSAACCAPGMEVFDRETCKRVEKAISETKVAAKVEIVSAAKAYFSFGALKSVLNKAMSDYSESGAVKFPAILINGTVISYGVPDVESIKSALIQASKSNENR